ncbi:MAG TPA: DMT family transporter [Actinomycetota bacterium]|nr:DMT family transporter [Actinomycetota bacterium]
MRSPRFSGLGALLVAVVIWGASFPVIQGGLGSTPVDAFLALRFFVAGLGIIPLLWWKGLHRPVWRRPGGWILAGLLYASLALQTEGLRLSTPGRVAFLTSLSVVIVPAVDALLRGRRPKAGTLVAVGFAAIGAGIIYLKSLNHFTAGDTFSVLCALGFAGYLLVAERVVRAQEIVDLTAMQLVGVTALAAVVCVLKGSIGRVHATPGLLASAAFAGLLATLVAFGAQLYGQARMGAVPTALVLSLEPVVAGALSVAFGRESLGWPLLAGGALLLGAALVGQLTDVPSAPAGLASLESGHVPV